MNLSASLIQEFKEDLESLAHSCQVRTRYRGRVNITAGTYWRNNSVLVSIYEENGFTKEESYKRAVSTVKNYNSLKSSFIEKWKGVFDESTKGAIPTVCGEGEYDVDYGMSVEITFNFGSSLYSVPDIDYVKYLKVRQELFNFLNQLTNINYLTLKDENNGVFCNISGYFKYTYSTGEITVIGRVHPYKEEIVKLSNLIGMLFTTMKPFNLPIQYVDFNRRCPSEKVNCYFFEIQGGKNPEYILWLDAVNNTRLVSPN